MPAPAGSALLAPTMNWRAAIGGVVLLAAGGSLRAAEDLPAFFPGARILFQGDSITDGGRWQNSSDPNHVFGQCYAYLVAARVGAARPDLRLVFLNRGVSGNQVTDLLARWPQDTLALKPGVVSVLVGVNDVLLALQPHGRVSPAKFEADYDRLLADTVRALPGVKLVLGEPFIEPGARTNGDWAAAREDIRALQGVVARLGAKYHAPVVRYQEVFDEACRRAPVETWIWDGVHPTAAGHELMAEAWLRTVRAAWAGPPAR